MGMDMVTKGVHNVIEFLSYDSPNMDVIGISGDFLLREIGNKVLKTSVSGLVELNILKNLTVYVVAGSLGRFKSHVSNIVFDEHSENILPSSEGDVGLQHHRAHLFWETRSMRNVLQQILQRF
ncbi:unnamed protein product [Brassica oleracea]